MKRKKITALFAALAMTASLITGCGASGSTEDSAAADTGTTESETAEEEAAVDEGVAEESASETESAGAAEAVTIWYYWETEGHQVALDQVIQ